jgi:Tol biopolymer transport system component
MNRPKLIRIHTIKGLKGLREDTLRPSFLFSARSILCSFLLFVACGLLWFAGAPVVDAKIVFCVADDIYVMNDNGSGIRRLTNNTLSKDRDPRWSPDGKRIAFTRYMDKERIQTSSELFIMDADGTDQKRLTHNTVADGYPSWSPDGQYLTFTSKHNREYEVYVIELASTTTKRLTGVEGKVGSGVPDWSPDGREIVYEKFLSNGGGLAHKNIYLMRANGEQQHPLFPDPQEGADTIIMRFFPRWSADGQRILFNDCKWRGDEVKCHLTVQRIGGGKQEITAIKLLGKNWLTSIGGWMENDRAIIFGLKLTDTPNPNYNLYRYVFQTRSLRRLTRDARDEKQPDWIEGSLSVSPQGKLPTQWGDIKATGRAHLPSSPLR